MTDTTPGMAPPGNPPMGRSHRPLKRLSFSGDGASYFGIWIVNILLSIVTIGIYSAWAKVRTRRYFYGNTFLDNDALDYHASPIAILKGRIIAVVVIIALAVLSELLPIAYLIAVLVLVVALPWIYNRSLRFNARMTSWRNVRFDFEGSYWPAFLAIIVMPVLAVFSLGLLLPVATRVRQNYMLNRLRYGTAPFEAEVPLGGLYGGLAIATLIFVAALAVLAGIGYGIFISQQHVILPLISELAGKMAGEMPELPGQVEGLDPDNDHCVDDGLLRVCHSCRGRRVFRGYHLPDDRAERRVECDNSPGRRTPLERDLARAHDLDHALEHNRHDIHRRPLLSLGQDPRMAVPAPDRRGCW